jgi:hypothetical protein
MPITPQNLWLHRGPGVSAGASSFPARFSRLILIALLIASGGCQVASLIADKTTGEEVPAAFKPKQVPTLVLAENFHDPSSVSMDAQSIEGFVADNLRTHKTVPVVDNTALEDLRSLHPEDYHDRTVRQLGQMVGAKQVIYINLTNIAVNHAEGSDAWHGTATAMVRVVDVQTGATLWPPQSTDGLPVDAATSYMNNDQTQEPTELSIRESLQHLLSDKVAELFYASSVEDTDQPEDILNK